MTHRLLLQSVLLMFMSTAAVWAQSEMSSGDIHGTVTDAAGAPLQGAVISAVAIETGVERRVTADAAGNYRILLLPPGAYALRAQHGGFAIFTRTPVPLTVGQSLGIDFVLQPVGDQLEILVQEELPALEAGRTQQSDTITFERIANLPINQRDVLTFALLTPGAAEASTLSAFRLTPLPGPGISFLGQDGRFNSVTVDGMDNSNSALSGLRSTIGQEAVREFQVNRSTYPAEFGRSSGGLLHIVSRSGTCAWHGAAFAFLRSQALDARNPFAFGPGFASIDPPSSRQQPGFTLSGPVRKERTFFFLSYEALRQRESRYVSLLEEPGSLKPTAPQLALIAGIEANSAPEARGLAPLLTNALTTSPGTFPETLRTFLANSGAYPYRNNDNTASLRLDHALSGAARLFTRLSFTDGDIAGALPGGLDGSSRAANYALQDYSAVAALAYSPGSSHANELRFQFANRKFDAVPADRYGPDIIIERLAELGRDYYLPSRRTERRYQALDNFTAMYGRHRIKLGGDFQEARFRTSAEGSLGGRFIFGQQIPLSSVIDRLRGPGTSAGLSGSLSQAGRADLIANLSTPITALQSFNLGLPLVYQQGFGNPAAEFIDKLLAGYIQDTFTVNRALTINAGLRYDVELQPAPDHRDANNWGPRFGFSYSPSHKIVVRGGYGVYFTPTFEAIADAGLAANAGEISQVYVPIGGLPQFGIATTSADVWNVAKQPAIQGNRTLRESDIAPLGVSPGTTPPVLLTIDQHLVNPYSQQFSLGIDRELPGRLNLSVSYLGNRGVKLLRSRNINLRRTGANGYGPVFGPIDPRTLQDNKVESSGSSTYHGLAVSVVKRYTRYYQLQLSYTFSKAIDDTAGFIPELQAADQLQLGNERSLSSFDRRHRLVVSGVLESPLDGSTSLGRILGDLKVAPILTVSGGQPFNLLLGFDANEDTQVNTDRPAFAGRNTGRGPDYVNLDLRVAREMRLARNGQVRLEGVFEAFNLFNRVNFNGVNGTVGSLRLEDYRVTGHREVSRTDPLGFTSASNPRQIQLGLRIRF